MNVSHATGKMSTGIKPSFNLFSLSRLEEQLSLLFLILLAFLLIYKISFLVSPSLLSTRVAIILGLAWLFLVSTRLPYKKYVFWLFLFVPYAFLQFLVVGEVEQLSRYINLFINSVLAASVFAAFAKTKERALFAIFWAVAIQSVIIIVWMGDFQARAWLDANIALGANFTFTETIRGVGFTSSAGAALSLIQALGFLCGTHLLRINGFRLSYFFGLLLCIFSASLAGRTGMLACVAFAGLFFIQPFSVRRLMAYLCGALLVGMIFLALFTQVEALLGPRLTAWMFSVFTGDDRTITTIANMGAPPISGESIAGFGRLLADGGGNFTGSDSGYVQMYGSIGLAFAAVFYVIYALVLVKLNLHFGMLTSLYLSCIFMALDFKEPFLFKYSILFVVLTVSLCRDWPARTTHQSRNAR